MGNLLYWLGRLGAHSFWVILAFVVVVLAGAMAMTKPNLEIKSKPMEQATVMPSFDFGNQTYLIDDMPVRMREGSFEDNDDHTASILKTNVSPSGDRAAAILVDNPGGSGSFYYLVGAMKRDENKVYSKPVLLPGTDRIKIVSVHIEEPEAHDSGEIVVTYLDHAPGAALADEPTVSTIIKYSFEDDGNLIEVLN